MSDMDLASGSVGKVADAAKLALQTLRDIFGVDARATIKNAEAEAKALIIESTTKMKLDRYEALNKYLIQNADKYIFHQRNLDAVLTIAAPLIEDGNPESLSEGFKHQFSEAAQEATEEELRELWARILSKEIHNPGAISRRTIETLKTYSKEDAEIIIKAAPYVIDLGGQPNLTRFASENADYNVRIKDVLALEEMGLARYVDDLATTFDAGGFTTLKCGNVLLRCELTQKFAVLVYPLTSVGRQLFGIVEIPKNYVTLQVLVKSLEEEGFFFSEIGKPSGLITLKPNPDSAR